MFIQKFIDLGFVFLYILFALFIALFIFFMTNGVKKWHANNLAEVIIKKCVVTNKRESTTGGTIESSPSTEYYITFKFDDETQIELKVDYFTNRSIKIGDYGILNYQGTRFNKFTKEK